MCDSTLIGDEYVDCTETKFTFSYLRNGNEVSQPIDITKNLFCLGGEREEIISSVFIPLIRQCVSKGINTVIIESDQRLTSKFANEPNALVVDFERWPMKNQRLEEADLKGKNTFIVNFSNCEDYEPASEIFEFLAASLEGPLLFLFSHLPVFARSYFFKNIHLSAHSKVSFVVYLEGFDKRNTYLTRDLIALSHQLLINCKYTLIGINNDSHIYDFASKYTRMDLNDLKIENSLTHKKSQYYFQSADCGNGYFINLLDPSEYVQNGQAALTIG